MMHSVVTAHMGQSHGSEGSWMCCGLRSASNLGLHQAAEAAAEQDETKPTSPLPARKREHFTFTLAGFRGQPHRPSPAVQHSV